jgi:GTP:adenosylcobinamide-phosphate guanylyltransferase
MRNAQYVAVITAGGRVDGEFAAVIGTQVKALAPFAGSTLLHRTIAALRGAGIERIAVVGGDEVRRACAHDVEQIVAESAGGAENLRRALYAWDGDAPLLYATSDMPFITAEAVGTFLDRSAADTLALPLTEWRDFERRFPQSPPFGITLAGEKVVNGGIFAVPPGSARRLEAFAKRFFDARKSPLRMARLTGPALLFQFLFKRLSVAKLQQHAERLLQMPARAVRNAPPELAYDVDVLEEYRYAIERA